MSLWSALRSKVFAAPIPVQGADNIDPTKTGRSREEEEVSFADPSRVFPNVGKDPTYVWNPNPFLGSQGLQIVDQMRRDDQVKAAMTFKINTVLSTGWDLAPGGERPEDWEPLLQMRTMLKRAQLDDSMKEILSALYYGFSISEKVLESEDGGMVVLKGIKTRAPHTWTFKCDPQGNIRGLMQNNVEFREDLLPKFLVYTHDKEFSNPYGRTDLEAVYRAWWTKKNAYQWMAMLLERMGIPPIFAMYNPNDYTGSNTVSVAKLRGILARMQAATTGAIPRTNKESIEFWSPELAGQVSTVFIPALELMNKDIARAALMPGLLGMTNDETQGSLARSRVQFDVFLLVVKDIQRQLTNLIQSQVVEPLRALNFAGTKEGDIQFSFLPFSEQAVEKVMDVWSKMVSGGVVHPQESDEKHVRNVLEFPEPNTAEQDAWAQEKLDKKVAETQAMAKANPQPAFPAKKFTVDAPRPLYVYRSVLNGAEIIAWAKQNGIATTLPESELHVTVAYSRKPIRWDTVTPDLKSVDYPACPAMYGDMTAANVAPSKAPRRVERLGDKGALVLMFDAWELTDRNRVFTNAGASWDYESYQPHITISYDSTRDVRDVAPYTGRIVLGPECYEEIREDAMENVVEHSISDAQFETLLERLGL